MQKVGAQFVVKKISDYVMAPPPRDAEEIEEEQPVGQAAPGSLDGQIITDENGEQLGVARHVANVAVYVIAGSRAGLEEQLKETITDPEGKVFFHHSDTGRLMGLIYAPDPSRRPAPVFATRAEDI